MKNILRNMSLPTHIVLAAMAIAASHARAQGSFQNLGFEDAAYPLMPNAFGVVSASSAIPGWTPYVAGIAGNGVLYNNISLGTAVVGLFENVSGTNQVSVIDGFFSMTLQAGVNPLTGTDVVSVAVGQSGLIPAGAMSIQLKAQPLLGGPILPGALEVDIAGHSVSMVPVLTTAGYTLYAGDISQFAGQIADLRISAVPIPDFALSNFVLDDIQFSTAVVPEPSTVSLLCLAALVLRRPFLRRRKAPGMKP